MGLLLPYFFILWFVLVFVGFAFVCFVVGLIFLYPFFLFVAFRVSSILAVCLAMPFAGAHSLIYSAIYL